MNRKISISVMIALLCLLGFGAASSQGQSTADDQLSELFASGYEVGLNVYDGTTLQVILQNYETVSYTAYTAELNEEQSAAYEAIDIFDENYEADMEEFLEAQDYTLEDLSSIVPSQEDLDAYIGMTMGELTAEGFEQYGYCWSDNDWSFYMENDQIALTVCIEDGTGIEDPDIASQEEIDALVISEATFDGISGTYFD